MKRIAKLIAMHCGNLSGNMNFFPHENQNKHKEWISAPFDIDILASILFTDLWNTEQGILNIEYRATLEVIPE